MGCKKRRVSYLLLGLLLTAVALSTGCNNKPKSSGPVIAETTDDTSSTFEKDNVKMKFDKSTGKLVSITNEYMNLNMDSFMIDVGYDGAYKLNLLGYKSFQGLATWEIPNIFPKANEPNKWEFLGFTKAKDGVETKIKIDTLGINTKYTIEEQDIKVSTTITNYKEKPVLINGIGFIMRGVQSSSDTTFDFPGNVPHNVYSLKKMIGTSPVQTGLVNSVIHVQDGENQYNVIFVDKDEKWSTGVYKDMNNNLNYINLAAVESNLNPKESLSCGSLYIQLAGKEDAFKAIRNLYSKNGWIPPKNGITDGPVYEGHPSGTFDSPFHIIRSMSDFARELEPIKNIGIKNFWVLPIFEHSSKGIYNTSDMSKIDIKYGTDNDVKTFTNTAHNLGLNVLFDYVPHGPEPQDPLAIKYKNWCSVTPEKKQQIEWDCVSFDMANPEYQSYLKSIVKDHVQRFDIDGARIDCAMGGLPNWNPAKGNRPSNSNLKGGLEITKAIREGFVEGGKKPLVLPENFNPIPTYYPYTDLFYDMPLYRTLYELNQSKLSEKDYAVELERWLNEEHLASPEGVNRLRFLGNHDTVSFVWDKARATVVYGEDKAKAMWALMSFIDGMPLIYEGDENPAAIKLDGPDLREFFKDVFGAREKWLGSKYDIEYITTNSPVIAFRRFNNNETRLVLVNLSKEKQTFRLENNKLKVLYGQCSIEGTEAVLPGYGYTIIS